ncbi:hypothetical protein LNK20_19895, partial [Bacillus safensis]|nr:hypothetical protein [Bacillus safensis]
QPGHSYALQARISAGDTLWFVNDERYAIDPENPGEPAEIKVVMVRKSGDEGAAIGIEGKDWLAEDIQGGGVIDNAQTTLTVSTGYWDMLLCNMLWCITSATRFIILL